MQYHGSHPHVGILRTEGGCPALARWRRDQQFGNVWQDQRSWSQQSLFPPASSDAFLHPHPPPSFLHWPPSSTTSHGPLSVSRPPDPNPETSFDHQIPEFALPPINHPPYSPHTFVPPSFRPQRNAQVPQGPGDFQHILHSQPSQSPTRSDMESHGQSSSDRQPGSDPQSTLVIPTTTTSVSSSESTASSSSHVNEQRSPSLNPPNHDPSLGSMGRVGGDGQLTPGQQSVPNQPNQPYARLPPPAPGSRVQSSDTAPERAARALQEQYGSLGVSFGAPARGHSTSSSATFGALRSRARAGSGSNGDNSETAGSPYSSLDDDSDPEEGGSRWQQTGLRSVRQAQILRGQMSNKRVASQRALLTLQPVEASTLPESERTCVICYNEFGVASPEGVSETPLRLPKCKHVFGNHCILKWFEESDSCPYCRDKLPSENAALSREAIRRMLQIARGSGLPLPRGMQTFRRPMQTLRRDSSMPDMFDQTGMRQRGSQAQVNTPQHRDGTAAGERRSPPEDSSDNQRRQRPRHEPSYSVSAAGRGSRPGNFLPGLPVTGPDNQQGHSPATTTSQQQSPVRQQFSPSNSNIQPQHGHQFNDFWARRAQTLHTSQQQPNFQHTPNFSHQPQASTVGSATLAPLPFMQQAPPFSNYMPPINGSGNNGTIPRAGNYQTYHNPVGNSNLQHPMSAEIPPGASFPGPPPPQPAAFYQQLSQLGQFQSASYPPSNPGPELGRHGLGIAGPGNYYTPN